MVLTRALLGVTLATAVAALVLALRSPEPQPPQPAPTPAKPAECQCDTAPLRAEIAALRSELAALRGFAERAASRPPIEAGTAAAPPTSPAPPPRRYVRFEVPHRGLDVHQDARGSLSVRNDDPALTGQIVVVQGEDEDGARHPVTLTVPPPETP